MEDKISIKPSSTLIRILRLMLLLTGFLMVDFGEIYALPERKINAGDAEALDEFGLSVSISGDYAIVGARHESPGGVNGAGSAYIYHRSGNNWTQQAKIVAGDAEEEDRFGKSVSISGDYAIVGALWEDPGGLDRAGSAYIFHRSGENWTQQAKITASDAESGDWFGVGVCINGDYVAVGARYENPGGVDAAGSAYIFHRSGENWTQQAKINASDVESWDSFGVSVSINGDYVIVGAPWEDPGDVSRAGSAYIFHRSGENWTQQAKITAADPGTDDYFGNTVSISGDYALVGAQYEDPDIYNAGSAYIFHRSGASWTQQAKIGAADAGSSDEFGGLVSIDGDYAIVGANNEDPGGVYNAGSAYIFHRSGASWTQQAKISAGDGEDSDHFGFSVSINGDYAAVGAWAGDAGEVQDAGSAYIYRHRVNHPIPRSQYVMMGIPCTVDNGDAGTLFQDDFNDSAPGHPRWRVSRYDEINGWYVRYQEGPHQGVDPFAPGLGFWIVQSVVSNCTIDVEADHLTDFEAEDQTFSVPISRDPAGELRGLTQIANPFHNSYDWSQTTITHSVSGTVPIATAAGNGWMDGHLYVWDPDQGQAGAYITYNFDGGDPKSMAVWSGGWVESYTSDADLTVNFTQAGVGGMPRTPGGEGGIPDRDSEKGWSLQLALHSIDGGYCDPDNRAAVNPHSEDGWDMYDAREFTPMSPAYVHLYFDHEDRGFRPGRYTWDCRSTDFDDGKTWKFTVRVVNLPDREFILCWHGVDKIDRRYCFMLENEAGGRLCNLRETGEYRFRSGNVDIQELNFRLVVTEATRGASDPMATEFGILSVQPNPFNSQTVINYATPDYALVKLNLYDITGRYIRFSGSEWVSAGDHHAVINGDDLAAGTYVVRLEAGGRKFERKIQLVK